MTLGWKLLVKWADGSCQWMDLCLLKTSNPVQVILDEPAFAWWVPYSLRKRYITLSAVKTQRTTHKYGIKVPRTLANALALDKQNGNRYWSTAVEC